MEQQIKVLGKNILARKVLTGETVSVSGIITLNSGSRDDRYTVIAVGPKTKDLIPGDTVYINPTAASEYVKYNGVTYRHLLEEDVYAKEEEV